MFLLGLFSLLGAMFDLPMKELTSYLPLEDEINEALCGEENSYSRYLDLTNFFESGDWDNLDFLLGELELDPVMVAKAIMSPPAGQTASSRSPVLPDQNAALNRSQHAALMPQ